MSDTGTPLDTGYSTPVPELDDHRHQSATIPRSRSRRGTVDTMHSVNPRNTDLGMVNDRLLGATIARDFEEAIIDEESTVYSHSPCHRGNKSDGRPRRGTIDTINTRSDSPPNSVKAFAEARRRERELSNAGTGAAPAIVVTDGVNGDGGELRRTRSIASRRSQPARQPPQDGDARSVKSFRTYSSVESEAEEDVCFPLHDAATTNSLEIDFEILEDFIAEEEIREAARAPITPGRVFSDQRNKVENTCFTNDGDIINGPTIPSDASSIGEKSKRTVTVGFDKIADAQRAPENRFEYFSSHGESTIHAADFGDLVLPGDDVRTLFTVPLGDESEDEGVWWLNMNSPTVEEIRTICKAFGVHPLTIEDIATHEAREKIELFPSYYFACFRSFKVEEHENGPDYEGFNTYVIVFREGTLSFSFSPNNHAANVRKRLAMLKDYVSLSSDWICYAMIDDIVDGFAPVITKIEHESDEIEDAVFIARSDDMQAFLRQIGKVRKNVMGLMKLLGGKADVLRGFTKRCNANYKVTPRMDIGLYLGDIQDHVVTMMSNLGHFEKMLSRSHANYLAALSIDQIQQGTRANEVLGRITLLASVLVPLNLVCGLFGMNVPVPWANSNSLTAFYSILGVLIGIVVMCLTLARAKRWI